MYARWGTFALGMGLVLAPVVLGYGSAGAILRDAAVGMTVCVGAVAALEWPLARFLLALPGAWLLLAGRSSQDANAAAAELSVGALVLVSCAFRSARLAPRVPAPLGAGRRGRVGARA